MPDLVDWAAVEAAVADRHLRERERRVTRAARPCACGCGQLLSNGGRYLGGHAPCGTYQAYAHHVRRGELIDRACRQARRDYDQQRTNR